MKISLSHLKAKRGESGKSRNKQQQRPTKSNYPVLFGISNFTSLKRGKTRAPSMREGNN